MQDYLKTLFPLGYKRFYQKNEILFFEGENPKQLFVLLSGKVRIYKTLEEATKSRNKSTKRTPKEQVLHQIIAPNFIAEMPSFLNQPFPANAACEEECEILEINLATLQKQCTENPTFCFQLIASLCDKIKTLESRITQNSLGLKERLMQFLQANLAQLPNLTQRQIAQQLNTSAESLSRVIRELKAQGILNTQKGKIVLKS
ncbi:Crp/Fnr family transcriptional regulator [Helicobacter sp. MIT 05-5294]|uniref:Crp/Fnr family transcriptional regulator n=1 Tax=Helicobacter sp. MIT 05-5294 TaxID=1548150 RepID=UPI00051F9F46|nr:Crp/Fnr family transcriptional regulator [Helicobacter sp. MIT 05-5294]TLD89215.1 Crp/Fnr family transcriptional regulator [Helicobacter sp. MIT 05-5294]